MPLRKIENMYDKLLKELSSTLLDIKKFDMGNLTAGIRVRGKMQDIRAIAKHIREEIQKVKRVRHKTRQEDK